MRRAARLLSLLAPILVACEADEDGTEWRSSSLHTKVAVDREAGVNRNAGRGFFW